ncbi:MAG: response regulator [Isosphaeraceae bacterium]
MSQNAKPKARVLSVGQCGYDHGQISRSVRQRFGFEVDRADTPVEAVKALRGGSYALVLVNRLMDLDGSPGLELVRTIKSDLSLAGTPVMLVSNYPDAQSSAVALGALPGFGKSQLDTAVYVERMTAALAQTEAGKPT